MPGRGKLTARRSITAADNGEVTMARDEDEAAVERAARRIAELQKAGKPAPGEAKTTDSEAASRSTDPKKA